MVLLKIVDQINIAVGKMVSFLIWAGIVVLVWEVVARYVLSSPTLWAHGYTQRIFGAYFILIGAYTLIRRDHVRVDIFLNTASPRLNALLDLLNYAFLIIWGGILVWEGYLFFDDAWSFGERDDSALGHPMWPIKLCLFVGALMITIQGVAEAIRSIILIVNPAADVMRGEPT